MDDKVSKLIDSVFEWWEEHEYDVTVSGGEEYNVYSQYPEFVRIAKEIKNEL